MFHVHLKIIKVGNSLGFVMPKQLLMALDIVKGDTVYCVARETGIYLTPYDPDFPQKLADAKKAWRKERRQLRLAEKRQQTKTV